jgi:hypothetical protein
MEWRTARFGRLTARALRQCHTRYVLPAPVLRRQNTRARRARGKPFHLLLKPVFNGDGVAEAMLNLDVIIDADAMSVACPLRVIRDWLEPAAGPAMSVVPPKAVVKSGQWRVPI